MRGPYSQFANQHSYVLIALAVLVAASVLGLGLGRRARMALLGGLLLIFVAVFAFLRFGSGDIRSAGEIEVALRAGHPVAVVFYSNYCIACLGAKPAFDGLEREFSGRATFLRVNLQSDAGRALAERYRVDTVPTFVAFDRDARVLLQLEGDPGVPVAELRQALLRSRAARSWR